MYANIKSLCSTPEINIILQSAIFQQEKKGGQVIRNKQVRKLSHLLQEEVIKV